MKIPTNWTFETPSVASAFDEHVREQLPWYDLATDALRQIARHYIPRGGLVYDIGASNGNVGRALRDTLAQRSAELVAIEPSSQMVDTYDAPGRVIHAKAEDVEWEPFDLAVSMLALMFVSPSRVASVVESLLHNVKPGGAVVLVERTLPPSGYPGIITSRLTLAAKAAQGAPAEQIIAKELSLAGVQRPLDMRWLATLGAVEWFRFGDFAGFLIEGSQS